MMTMTRGRGNTTARGYGNTHQQLRKRVAKQIAAGTAVCWRCGQPVLPWMLWDLGHDDYDRSIWRGPEHRHCNRSAAATRNNRLRGKRSKTIKIIKSPHRW
jgi:formate-dependent nitrite reductase cytochrome c552 subunit